MISIIFETSCIIWILRTILFLLEEIRKTVVYNRVYANIYITRINEVTNIFGKEKLISEIIFRKLQRPVLQRAETAIREEYNTLRYEFTLYKIRDKRQIFDIPAALEESWDCSGDARGTPRMTNPFGSRSDKATFPKFRGRDDIVQTDNPLASRKLRRRDVDPWKDPPPGP